MRVMGDNGTLDCRLLSFSIFFPVAVPVFTEEECNRGLTGERNGPETPALCQARAVLAFTGLAGMGLDYSQKKISV